MERLTVRVKEGNRKDECFIPGNKNAIEKVEYICEGERWESEEYKGKAVDKLAEYEDLEEQGKLLKLPAAIGDEIFFIFMDCPKDYKEEYCRDHDGSCENCPHRVPEIVSRDFRMLDIPNMDRIFVTRQEAEAALKELERGKGE